MHTDYVDTFANAIFLQYDLANIWTNAIFLQYDLAIIFSEPYPHLYNGSANPNLI